MAFGLIPPRCVYAIDLVRRLPHLFRREFDEWLLPNWDLYLRFEAEANRVWSRGRRVWSSETIVQYLRHETMIRDVIDEDFKLNEKWTSSLARLYVLLNPSRKTLFEFRERILPVPTADDFALA